MPSVPQPPWLPARMLAKLAFWMRVFPNSTGSCATFSQTTCFEPDPSMPGSGVWIGHVRPPSQLKSATDPIRYHPVSTYGSVCTGQTLSGPMYSHAWSFAGNATGICTTVQ